MFWLGKKRSNLGRFLDKHSISTVEFSKESKVNRKTLGEACNDSYFIPSSGVIKKILKVVRKIEPDKKMSDFWDI